MITINKDKINEQFGTSVCHQIGKAILSNSFSYASDNSGNGTITGLNAIFRAPTEKWTLTCIDDSTAGSEVFSVVGSISGSKANATVGTAYNNEIVSFTINDGSTDWAKGDIIYANIQRDIIENNTILLLSTLQIEVDGDSTICDLDFKATIKDNYFTKDNIALTTNDFIEKGKIVGLSEVFYNKGLLHFNNIDTTITSTVTVYGA